MTKEELEKEAEEKYSEVDREFIACQDEGEVFNIGYILGAEPREKRIADLESTNKKISDECHKLVGSLEKKQNENAELDCQKNRNKFCYSCANATERCFRNEIGCPCEKYKSWKEENAELKNRNQELLESCEGATMMYKDLQKANEIIKKYLSIGVGGKITQNYLDVTKEAEQFLSEMKK